jgi:phosphohistidine swiveling domain-containing protein
MKKPKFFNDSDPWMLAEDIPDIDFQFSQIWLSAFANDLVKTVKREYKRILCVYRGYNLKFYYGERESDDFAKHILKMIVANPDFGEKINQNIRKHSDVLKKFSEQINPDFLKNLSNSQLSDFYEKLDKIHTELYTWGWLPNAIDMFHGNFTNYIKSILRLELDEDEVNSALVVLSTHPEKSIIQQEHESFLNLVVLFQKKNPKFSEALNKHLEKYFYLKHLWIGKHGVYNEKYYINEIKKFISSGENAAVLLGKENRIFRQTLKKQKQLYKKLHLARKQIRIVNIYAEFAVTKLYRRDAQLFWAYKMDFIFAELAKRLKISFMESRFMFPREVKLGLRDGKITPGLRKELKQRTKYFIYYAEKDLDMVFYGKKAATFENKIVKNSDHNVSELNGQTACVGKVQGRVKIVNSIRDMKKMKQGDILVSIATNPDVVPAMKKAGAIVTEQGGITSHAAIVSREMGTPCVIGTKIATKVFKDGDMVEVDAYKGIVRKL